jgi:hypothetical protein
MFSPLHLTRVLAHHYKQEPYHIVFPVVRLQIRATVPIVHCQCGVIGTVTVAALAFMGCGAPAKGEVCAAACFEMTPEGAAMYPIENRQVCFKSKQQIGECWIWNYRIPPKIDFTDYIDIHYDQGCDTNDVTGGAGQGSFRLLW